MLLWYHLSLPLTGPHGILADPQAVPGLPVFAYYGSAKPLRKEFHTAFPAALHRPAALWRNAWRVLVFIIALFIDVFCLV